MLKKFYPKTCGLLLLSIMLNGCIQSGRYTMKNDKAPLRPPTSLETSNPTPVKLPIYPPSLRPYKVLGKHYVPLKSAKGYVASGVASWYGRKFHNHLTSNGERYDMFAMSAAHKTLPIPSFARVTNIDNQRSIIVRVNDRGPFHDKRLVDLSYAAAYALDMLNLGTANVKLEAIVVDDTILEPAPVTQMAETTTSTATSTPLVATTKAIFIQVFASSDVSKINRAAEQLSALLSQPTRIPSAEGIYKLRVGPLKTPQQARDLINTLKNNGYPDAYMLYSQH